MIVDVSKIIPLRSVNNAEVSAISQYLVENDYKFGRMDVSFSEFIWLPLKEGRDGVKPIKHFFEGKIVVDVGAGGNWAAYEIALMLGCKAYVAVEPFNHATLRERLEEFLRYCKEDRVKSIPIAIVASDALTFLKRVPDHSVSLMSFGTDGLVFQDEWYNEQVRKEIGRCLLTGGAFLGHQTTLRPAFADKSDELQRETFLDGEIYHF